VRITLRKFSSGLLLTLLAAVFFVTGSSPTYAQSNTRSFQMGLWTDPSPDANSDIALFWDPDPPAPPPGSQPQPPAPLRTILLSHHYDISLYAKSYDWSRIVAVEIDEPYSSLDSVLKYPDNSPACRPAALNGDIAPIDAALEQRAAELQALAPKARFWVNFTRGEASWMQACVSPHVFNRAYIDVVSADWSDDGANNDISTIQPFYSVIAANRPKPDQQLALIPGVYSAPYDQLPHLQGFFDYANNANNTNQTCNLPLGPRGVTGVFDGCLVWIVMGWLSSNTPGYVGMLDPNPASQRIAAYWEAELALPLAPALAHQRSPAQIIQPVLQLLLQ
jgi:hypothetical protein